ncbi:MAG: hypothetical protein EBS42_11830 [Caulobacteraceae bacterium]|nr:hypothetical protein [Caulobacteraceae bacterium]
MEIRAPSSPHSKESVKKKNALAPFPVTSPTWDNGLAASIGAPPHCRRACVPDDRAEDVLRQQAWMEAERSGLDAQCQEVAERVLTRQRDFGKGVRSPGGRIDEKLFDSTAPLALDRFAAAMENMLTPRTLRWHDLVIRNWRDDRGQTAPLPEAVRAWLQAVNTALFSARYAAGANFASQAHETYVGLGAFGNGVLFVDDDLAGGLRYRSVPFARPGFPRTSRGWSTPSTAGSS